MVDPDATREHMGSVSMTLQIEWLTPSDGGFGDDPAAERNNLLLRNLQEAAPDLTEKPGAEPH